jgi:hypothetical protein
MNYLLTKQRALVLIIEDLNGTGFGARCEGQVTTDTDRDAAIAKAKGRARAVRVAVADATRAGRVRTAEELTATADAAEVIAATEYAARKAAREAAAEEARTRGQAAPAGGGR